MLKLLNEVLQDLQLSPEEVQRVKFFVLSQHEPRGWGFLDRAALVGYPLFFHYSRVEEVPYGQCSGCRIIYFVSWILTLRSFWIFIRPCNQ
jgi:hypothetical protein